MDQISHHVLFSFLFIRRDFTAKEENKHFSILWAASTFEQKKQSRQILHLKMFLIFFFLFFIGNSVNFVRPVRVWMLHYIFEAENM